MEEEEEEGDCVVHIISAFSNKILCTLQLPKSSMVLDVKRRVQTTPQGINIFRQRLIISPAGPQVEDHEVLAALPGRRLQLVKLEYTDDNEDEERQSLRAASEGVVHEVERLLRLPLWPDCRQAEDGDTALIVASENGHLDVVQLLCEAGANKDKADDHGFTALMQASVTGHLEVVRLLCEAGADTDKANQEGATALMFASDNGHHDVVQLLCEAGADKDKADRNGDTALLGACTPRAPGGGAGALRGSGRQGQGNGWWCHSLDAGIFQRSPGGGAAAMRDRRRQGQGEPEW